MTKKGWICEPTPSWTASRTQHAAFLGTVARGSCPLARQTRRSGWRSRPGSRSTASPTSRSSPPGSRPGMQIVERLFGLLEVHHEDPGRSSGGRRRDPRGPGGRGRFGPDQAQGHLQPDHPQRVDAHQVQLVNRMRHGHMLLAGQTLYVLEVEPAGYAALAANEAEKRSQHKHPRGARLRQLRPGVPGRRGAGHHGRIRGGGRRHRGRRGTCGRESRRDGLVLGTAKCLDL